MCMSEHARNALGYREQHAVRVVYAWLYDYVIHATCRPRSSSRADGPFSHHKKVTSGRSVHSRPSVNFSLASGTDLSLWITNDSAPALRNITRCLATHRSACASGWAPVHYEARRVFLYLWCRSFLQQLHQGIQKKYSLENFFFTPLILSIGIGHIFPPHQGVMNNAKSPSGLLASQLSKYVHQTLSPRRVHCSLSTRKC